MGIEYSQATKERIARADRKRARADMNKFRGFVDYPWDDGEFEELKAWDISDTALFENMSSMVGNGFVFRFIQDKFGSGVQCQCYGAPDDPATAGLAMSGRGSTAARALKQLLFASTALNDDWSTLEGRGRRGATYNE